MNIWLVTTGSSDIQLTTDEYWNDWYERSPVKRKCHDLPFKPTQIVQDEEEPYRVPPRVLGRVYEEQPDEVLEYLKFPLIERFSTQLKDKQIDKIIILVTDQSAVFPEGKRENIKCPYWQDTYELESAFELYLQNDFANAQFIRQVLLPKEGEPGLDDWNNVLKIVQSALDEAINKINSDINTIYISHQAGTPAISSAVQFASLAKFGKKVQFVVSDEYNKSTSLIESSEYLWKIKLQEINALLDRRDYDGVKSILSSLINNWEKTKEPKVKEIRELLKIAILWNLADFKEFKSSIEKRDEVDKERVNNWWWSGYEAGYLAVVRLEQGNVVEAMFHSFRSVEGTIREWALWKYKQQIQYSNPNQPTTPYFHNTNIVNQPKNVKDWFNRNKHDHFHNVVLFGEKLFSLLEASSPKNLWQKNSDIQVVAGDTREERNSIFHCLRGLQEENLFKAWDTRDRAGWEARLVSCLNFVSGEKFQSLKKASLMANIHEKLKEAIASYI
ncbi:hypothetical protein [Merismopedia glauca]|uniref:CRISPR-associated protein n=1 Tax=Merismopedia glauca CCAP 1448/3 TaxID=1296344 RepID=A0A2T1BX46_9CYAN|nr:hypothetical protein [Merismopedia glauca]PSB00562.1 hypothetical protein C7B64_22860 [Merismopedia glauca CCAP 1448/3]